MSIAGGARAILRWSAASIGLTAGAYMAYVAVTWCRYGQTFHAVANGHDDLLDRLMPTYEVASRHRVRISAPAAITLSAAREMNLLGLPLVRAIVRGRELVLRSTPVRQPGPPGLLDEMLALGWCVLAEEPDREIVVGAVTQPWKANVVFRGLLPDEFVAFNEPGYVKIVWTLRADPLGPAESIFQTNTRVVSTDPQARARFRWYWSLFSPGMHLIRWASLAPLKREAERRARGLGRETATAAE